MYNLESFGSYEKRAQENKIANKALLNSLMVNIVVMLLTFFFKNNLCIIFPRSLKWSKKQRTL